MMMREQQWDRSNCRHFRIDVFASTYIMRSFVNARKNMQDVPVVSLHPLILFEFVSLYFLTFK